MTQTANTRIQTRVVKNRKNQGRMTRIKSTPTEEVKMAYKGPAKAKLVTAVKEINKVMAYDPAIEANQTNQKLYNEVVSVLGDIEPADKESFGKGAWSTIVEIAQAQDTIPEWAQDKKEEEKEPEKETGSKDEKKTETKRPAAKKAEKPEAGKKEQKPTPASTKMSRSDATIQAIDAVCKKGGTKTDIMNAANDIYVKNGGTSSKLQHINNVPNAMIKALVAFNVLEVSDSVYKFVE